MAEITRPPRHERLLIKVIMPKQYTERKVPGGGAPPKPFRPVDQKYRASLSSQVLAIRTAIVPQIKTAGAAPVRVKLVSKAVAKSHRPEHLFSAQSCPIVSGGTLGELFVKATPEGLDRLTEIIEHNESERMMKELSCVETIEPVTPSYRRSGLEAAEVLRNSPRGKKGFVTRVGLFNFGPDRDQPKLVADLEAVCKQRDIALNTRGYSLSSFTYEAECRTVDDVEALSRVIGVRSIAPMPLIRTIRPRMFAAKPLPPLPTAADVTGCASSLSTAQAVSIATVPITGATNCDVYRTAGHTSTGKIGNVACGSTIVDTGLVGDGTSAPATNNTGTFNLLGGGNTPTFSGLQVNGNASVTGNLSIGFGAPLLYIDPVAQFSAAGVNTTTTGSITSGTNSLTVASAAGWATGMGVAVANAGSGGNTELVCAYVAVSGSVLTLFQSDHVTACNAAATASSQTVNHDDSAAIAASIATGKPVWLRPGNYNVSSGFTLSSPISVTGAGPYQTIIWRRAATGNLFAINWQVPNAGYPPYSNSYGGNLGNFSIIQDQNITATAGCDFFVQSAGSGSGTSTAGLHIGKVHVDNTWKTFCTGTGQISNWFTDSTIYHSASGYGIEINTPAPNGDTIIANVYMSFAGVKLIASDTMYFSNLKVNNASIVFATTTASDAQRVRFINLSSENGGSCAVDFGANGANSIEFTGGGIGLATNAFCNYGNATNLNVNGVNLYSTNNQFGYGRQTVGPFNVTSQGTLSLVLNGLTAAGSGAGSGFGAYGALPTGSGNRLGFTTFGYISGVNTASPAYRNSASIEGFSTQAWTDGSAQGSKIVIGTTPNGTSSRVTALTIDQDQSVTVKAGGNTLYRCSVAGTLRAGQTTTVSADCGTAVDTGLRVP